MEVDIGRDAAEWTHWFGVSTKWGKRGLCANKNISQKGKRKIMFKEHIIHQPHWESLTKKHVIKEEGYLLHLSSFNYQFLFISVNSQFSQHEWLVENLWKVAIFIRSSSWH